MKLIVDECLDANGFWTVRVADGTPSGNTQEQPVATFYDRDLAEWFVYHYNSDYYAPCQ